MFRQQCSATSYHQDAAAPTVTEESRVSKALNGHQGTRQQSTPIFEEQRSAIRNPTRPLGERETMKRVNEIIDALSRSHDPPNLLKNSYLIEGHSADSIPASGGRIGDDRTEAGGAACHPQQIDGVVCAKPWNAADFGQKFVHYSHCHIWAIRFFVQARAVSSLSFLVAGTNRTPRTGTSGSLPRSSVTACFCMDGISVRMSESK